MSFGLSSAAISTIGIGANLAGSLLASDAASTAGDTLSNAGGQAAQLQRQQYTQTRNDLSPYRDTGALANNRLAQLLGLGSSTSGGFTPKTADQLRSELLGQYTRPGSAGGQSGAFDPGAYTPAQLADFRAAGYTEDAIRQLQNAPRFEQVGRADDSAWMPVQGQQGGSYIDEQGLNAEIQRQLAAQGGATAGTQIPGFGSLLAPAPAYKQFTQADLNNDLVFQNTAKTALDTGVSQLNNRAAQAGGYFSGGALKDLTRFSADTTNKYTGDAYNRNFAQQQDLYNRDMAGKNQIYGFLSGTAGAGQNAANMTGTAGANAASQQGNYLTQAANAQASGQVGAANALSAGASNFQNYNMMNSLFNKRNTGSGYSASEPYPGYNASIGF